MSPFEDVDADTLLAGHAGWIDGELQAALASHPGDCVDTEYPHWVGSVSAPDDLTAPSEAHPVFYGCFDWHSAVHSYWCLIRQLRLFPEHPEGDTIRTRIDERITPEHVAGEVEYFEDNPTFEKPYGWGWLLRLAAELHLWEADQAAVWRDALRPLEDRIVELVREEFLTEDRPIRVGTHGNSAFALTCVLDYARVVGRADLADAAVEQSREFFADDCDAPVAYEPIGWDFFSPALVEADLMRRVLEGDAFTEWLGGFLPDVTGDPHAAIHEPVDVDVEAGGGAELHLVGLNLSRAWCLAALAEATADEGLVDTLERGARRHAERGVADAFTDDYAGAHWLSSYVLYLLTRNEGGIAPAPLG